MHGTPSPYLAREPELERLHQRLQDAHDGRGGVVVIRGPAGSGTTRTAHELAARADRLGLLVLWGRWFEGTCGRPYGAFAEALEEYATGAGPAGLAATLGDGAPSLVRLAPRVSQALANLRPAAPLDAPDAILRLHLAYLGWLSRVAAATPLLLVLDGWQWADTDSLRLLAHICRFAAPLPMLVVATDALLPSYAGAAPTSTGEAIDGLPGAEVVVLSGLDEGATAVALAPVLAEPISAAAVALIQEVTGGEPLWARELLRHLRDENRLDDVRGRGLPAAADLPETFEQLIAWRVSRLGPEVRAALSALAAFHDGATPMLLAQIGGVSRGRMVEFLEVAVRHGLARGAGQGQTYVVVHDRIRLALLGALSPLQRAQLHRRLAETLEAELGNRTREHSGELFHHYHRSAALDGAERGLRHGLLAAEQARAAFAYVRAAQCLESSMAIASSDDPRLKADLAGRLAQSQAEAGLLDQVVVTAAGALRAQRQANVHPTEAVDQLVAVLRLLRHDDIDELRAEQEALRREGLEHAGRADPITRARLELLVEGWQAVSSGSVSTLVWATVAPTVSRALREGGTEADLAELLSVQRPRTRDETAAAARQARTWRQPASVLRAMRAVATDLVTRHGLFREGASWAGLYLSNGERYGSARDLVVGHALNARSLAALGRLAEAQSSLAEADRLLAGLPEPGRLPAELLVAKTSVAYYLDADWPATVEALERAVERPSPMGLALNSGLCLALARTGNDERARKLLPDLLDACSQVPPLTYERDGALITGLAAAWELGAAEHATNGRTLLDLAVGAQVGTQVGGSPRHARARLLGLAGNVDEARSYFAEERDALDSAGVPPLRAIVDHDEALTIAAASTSGAGGAAAQREAAKLLERAAQQFAELGMDGWLQRTQELIAGDLEAEQRPGGRLHFTYPLGLSRREADIVRLVSEGATTTAAAGALGLDEETAARHLASAMTKLELSDPADLPRAARHHGLGGGV